MKLAFFGSRTLFNDTAKGAIYEAIALHKPDEILTASEPDGVCKLAQQVAKEKAIPLTVYFLNFKYLRGAFEHRSKEVIENADFVVLLHDGKSKGTMNELEQVKKMRKKWSYELIEVEPTHKEIKQNIAGKH